VYRRRRLAVLGGLLAVIVVIVLIIVRPGFGGPQTAEPDPSEDIMLEVVAPPDCLPTQLELVAKTDQSSYDSGVQPQVWLAVTNTSSLECSVAVGTERQRYVITSGEDQIWASDDCQEVSAPLEIVLGPGESQETGSIPWDRTRSTPDTCDGERPTMPGGGSSYHLRVSLGEVSSQETKQFLLN